MTEIKPVKAWAAVRNGVFLFTEFHKATVKTRIQQEWHVSLREFDQFGFRVIPVMIVPMEEKGRGDAESSS